MSTDEYGENGVGTGNPIPAEMIRHLRIPPDLSVHIRFIRSPVPAREREYELKNRNHGVY